MLRVVYPSVIYSECKAMLIHFGEVTGVPARHTASHGSRTVQNGTRIHD
jgi:hypothetical protein